MREANVARRVATRPLARPLGMSDHEHCPCVAPMIERIVELEQAQAEHIETHRREAILGHPTYDRRAD